MDKNKMMLSAALIIAIASLVLNLILFAGLAANGKKIAAMEQTVKKMDPVVEKFTPLLSEMEAINQMLPRLKQLLIGMPS